MLCTGLDLLKSFSCITTVNDEGQAVAQLKHLMKVPPLGTGCEGSQGGAIFAPAYAPLPGLAIRWFGRTVETASYF